MKYFTKTDFWEGQEEGLQEFWVSGIKRGEVQTQCRQVVISCEENIQKAEARGPGNKCG